MSPALVALQVVLKVGQGSQEDRLGHTETNLCRELDSTDLEHEGSGHPAISGMPHHHQGQEMYAVRSRDCTADFRKEFTDKPHRSRN